MIKYLVKCKRVLLPCLSLKDEIIIFAQAHKLRETIVSRIKEGGKKLVPLPLCSNSIPRPRASVDVGYETTISVPGPSSGSKGRTRQNTRIFPFSSYIDK